MTRFAPLLAALLPLAASGPALAQDADFNLTYHVERTPAAQLDIDTCGATAGKAAEQAGLRFATQSYPGQLVTVSGGTPGTGAFVVQCISVEDTTVTVVQGIDYRAQQGPLAAFADAAFAAIKAAAK